MTANGRKTARASCSAAVVAAVAAVVLVADGAGAAPRPTTVVDGLSFPAGLAFDGEGTLYVTERAGAIRAVVNGELQPRPVARIETTVTGEAGLLDIAIDPGGDALYAFATTPTGGENQVWRVPLPRGEPEVVIDGLPASGYHNGGGVAFLADGSLLVSNGETHEDERAQDPEVLGGKVYRFTRDGRIPSDNPFGASPAWAIGLRNPFGMTVDPATGDAWVTENGPHAFDEVNRIERGANYGWPLISGPAGRTEDAPELTGAYREPVLSYLDIIVPTGIAFADPQNAIPAVAGDLFFGTYGEQTIHRVRLNAARDEALSDEIYLRSDDPVVALEWGPDGLYFTTPAAVKVLPLARDEGRTGAATPPSRPTPSGRSPSPGVAGGEGDVPRGTVVVGLVLLIALVWSLSRARPRE